MINVPEGSKIVNHRHLLPQIIELYDIANETENIYFVLHLRRNYLPAAAIQLFVTITLNNNRLKIQDELIFNKQKTYEL